MPLHVVENRRQPGQSRQFGKGGKQFFLRAEAGASTHDFRRLFVWNVTSNSLQEATNAAMISKCANPSCSKMLMRLDGGRFFGFPIRDKNAIEHFWLCLNCSKEFTLKLSEGRVELAQKKHKKIA